MKIRTVGGQFFHADGRTRRIKQSLFEILRTHLIMQLSNFSDVSKSKKYGQTKTKSDYTALVCCQDQTNALPNITSKILLLNTIRTQCKANTTIPIFDSCL